MTEQARNTVKSAPDDTEEQPVTRHRPFQLLWAANVATVTGSQFGVLAMSVTAVSVLEASAFEVSLIAALSSVAFLVLGLPAGVWVDRCRKKRVMIVADLVRAAAIASIPAAYAADILSVAQLMLVAVVVSTGDMFFNIAHTSILPALVSRRRVSEATAGLASSDTTISVVGPGIAGQLLRVAAAPLVYVITALTHLLSAAFVIAIDVDEPSSKNKTVDPFWASMKEGLTFVAGSTVLRTFLISGALVNFAAGIYKGVLAIFVLRELDLSPAEFGVAASIGAVGGILGSMLGLRLKKRLGSIRAVITCYSALSVAFAIVPMARVLTIPAVVTLTVSSGLFSCLLVMSSISSTGINARVTPSRLMGRVSSARRFVTMGAVPLGALVGGGLATVIGAFGSLWVAAAVAATTCIPFLLSPLRTWRDLPSEWEVDD